MFKGFYSAASGMLSQQRKTDTLTNNLANVNTPAFKTDTAVLRAFPEMLLQRLENKPAPVKQEGRFPSRDGIGSLNTGVYVQEIVPNFIQGDLRETGVSTDMAIRDHVPPVNEETGREGTFFFTLMDGNNATRYTRNGNFSVSSQGFLTTSDGLVAMDINNQPIQLKSDNFQMDSHGFIAEDGRIIARLNIAAAENINVMVKEGNGLYRTEDGRPLPTAIDDEKVSFELHQGFLERSNVDAAQTMTDLLSAYRAFEANQKVVQAYDRSMEKAVNEIGRLG